MRGKFFYYLSGWWKKLSALHYLFGLSIFVISSSGALALTPAQLHSIYSDSVWYKASSGPTGAGGGIGGSADPCLGVGLPTITNQAAVGQAIDAFLNKHAPGGYLNGLGQQIVDGAVRQGVNPFLVVGVAGEESSWTTGPNVPAEAIAAHNAFGNLSGGPGSSFHQYASWALSVNNPSGGDEPSLLKSTYLSDSRVVDLLSFTAKYLFGDPTHTQATPGVGDPVKYANDLTQWIYELEGGAGGGITCSSAGIGSGSVSSIFSTALLLSWPQPGDQATPPRDPLLPKPEYVQALQQYNSSQIGNGADCGVFVATVMHMSRADPNYPTSGTAAQAAYVLQHPELYQVTQLGPNDTTQVFQPGDILIVNQGSGSGALGHTMIIVPQSGGYNEASASLNSRMPNLGSVASVADPLGRGYYLLVRHR